ncbi:hypothetical protein B0A48_11759 [Cryoendolithus antarcticus]|uniref:Uncharacterized protein n=1 Tax=Cryoendolithus antarcticus TaxID=1507870 RepID=A0A1V8SSP2_9PEZI|nr:hypothetical protein B0A48_11759 [Cryoendolithus antarcticus]
MGQLDHSSGNATTIAGSLSASTAPGNDVRRESVESARSSLSSVYATPLDGARLAGPVRSNTASKDFGQPLTTEAKSRKPRASRSDSAPTARRRPGIGQQTRTERPKPTHADSTLRRSLRRMTSAQFGTKASDPYAVNFESASSDSSSSSDSEQEAQVKKGRSKKSEGSDHVQDGATNGKDSVKKKGTTPRFKLHTEHVKTKGRISKRDGRLNISVNETANSGYVAKALGHTIKNHLDIPKRRNPQRYDHGEASEVRSHLSKEAASLDESLRKTAARPRLNIVIMVIGSRGDIQPFLKVGMVLKNQYGHRVRIATHLAFREFVEQDGGLEFFNIGGNPSELMAFMVKNPGLIPKFQTVKEGEIGRRREQMAEMFEGFWRACVNTTDDEHNKHNLKLMGDKHPFIAHAIIANPPSMAHIHIAERLGIPLHMMFTFPYSPTQAWPHPVANIKPGKSNVDESYVNFMSYALVEMMTFSGLGDLLNVFRTKTLGLEPVSPLWAPGALYRMKVPYTYMWSPALVSKPKDWGPEIDIGGFVFLDLGSKFTPPDDLKAFLDAGDPPVYIGFGSIVVDDPDRFTQMIFKAAKMAGVRALVNKGWGGLGGEGNDVPDHVYMLGNTPHDWLFPRVKAVVHHGGAGTTAIGLKLAKPTMIVPFFGDQPFWGAMVAEAKAGAFECIPYKKLNAERLAEGIKQCLTEEAQINVQKIADSIAKEGDGAENAVKSFHRSLPLKGAKTMRCSILEDRVAVWKMRNSPFRLSALAAELLVEGGKIRWEDLKLLRVYEWADFDGPGEPITGGAHAITSSLYDIGEGVGMVPMRIAKHVKKREAHEKKKQAAATRRAERIQRKQAKAMAARKAADAEPTSDSSTRATRPSNPRQETTTTLGSALSADPAAPLAHEIRDDVGTGFKASGTALLAMPLDIHMAVAQGFHNAPRLYGDATVRKPIRITGVKTGWRAARKEFTYGVYDGFTGLVTQPVGGWKEEDTLPAKFGGLGKGVAKGVGGLVLKNITAIVAPPAFLATGVRKYVEKRLGGPGTDAYIRKVHIIQGVKDLQALDDAKHAAKLRETRTAVEEGWKVYDELWKEVHHFRNAAGRGPLGRIKKARETKQWEEDGVLTNVSATEKALEARRRGEDLEVLFERRREALRKEADEARAPTLEQQPQLATEEKTADAPQDTTAVEEAGAASNPLALGSEKPRDDAAQVNRAREGSESTAVTSESSSQTKGAAVAMPDHVEGAGAKGGVAEFMSPGHRRDEEARVV